MNSEKKSVRPGAGNGQNREICVCNYLNPFPVVDLVGNPCQIELPASSLAEVVALGPTQHLTQERFRKIP